MSRKWKSRVQPVAWTENGPIPERDQCLVHRPTTKDTESFYIERVSDPANGSYYHCMQESIKDAQAHRELQAIKHAAKIEQRKIPTCEDRRATEQALRYRRAIRCIIIG